MSKKICKSNPEWEDVAHYCIIKFTEHERAQELVESGRAMNFLSGMIYRSFWSQTSQYYTEYHQKGKMVHNGWDKPENSYIDDIQDEPYDIARDNMIEACLGVLEDMKHASLEGGNRDSKLYYMADLLEQYLETPNYSALERRLKIPRTSIAQAVDEAIIYIRQTLKYYNIDYDNP